MKKRFLALMLSVLLLVSCFPLTVFAEETLPKSIDMVEGDIEQGFVPAGTSCTSADPAIAWVDQDGNLNALKEGATTISAEGMGDCTVTVGDYSDGSDVVGNLKILARYNDSMQFYDGHVYLLFTSYQDDVTISVPDLYGGYRIDDTYYEDIREDISFGSNHTGSFADDYFTFDDSMTSVSLDRGEIVTIGMYRDFDLTTQQAALGSIQNSSAWKGLTKEVKSAIISNVFSLLTSGKISADEAVERIKTIMAEAGEDYHKLLDGVVNGGVCFNRELYNQKLEWDQYENVTYEMDITENQLRMMSMYLNGNLNKFSILKNSCATVALRAWNAAVGTRNGKDTAYHISCEGEGIFALVDAPKGVRDGIVNRLPGYCLNNSEGVAEPDASFEDETGFVYVSAPEKVSPLAYVYADDSVTVDSERTKLSALLKTAKAGQKTTYQKDAQQVDVSVRKNAGAVWNTLSGIDFGVNGATFSLTEVPEGGIWFKTKINDPEENTNYYVAGSNGKAIPSDYEDGCISFRVDQLPITYKIVADENGSKNILKTEMTDGDCADTEIYYYKDGEKVAVDGKAQIDSGTKVYIKSSIHKDDYDHVLHEIVVKDQYIVEDDSYDTDEGAYFIIMPEKYSVLQVIYGEANLQSLDNTVLQVSVGDELDVNDHAMLTVGEFGELDTEHIAWRLLDNEEQAVELKDGKIKAVKEGTAHVAAFAKGNENILLIYTIKVYDDTDKMVPVNFDEDDDKFFIHEDGASNVIPYSGYLVKPGSKLCLDLNPEKGEALILALANRSQIPADGTFTVTEETAVTVKFAPTVIEGMPDKVNLADRSETYQLSAAVRYTGLMKLLHVYDPTITYESSDPLVTVDENGLITVTGDIPEGGKAVYVTAYAGSSNRQVSAQTKVILGDYDGDAVVGKLTIYGRRIAHTELIPHGAVVFTTYEDIDLDVSYYEYYKPDDRYKALMTAYERDPDSFTSDPALYKDNELGLEDRESYFEVINHGSHSDPAVVSLKAGESASISLYSFDNEFSTVFKPFENGTISNSKDTQELIRQFKAYAQGGEIDGEVAFDSMLATMTQLYAVYKQTGYVIADGPSTGGICVNREMYNQFKNNDYQTPSVAYSVEITADELAEMQKFVSNPDNNYYSLFNKNCISFSISVWNAVLADRPDYLLKGDYTGLVVKPTLFYSDLALMGTKGLDGESIVDYYPRTVAFLDDVMIGDVDGDGEVTVYDAALIQKYVASMVTEDQLNMTAADIDGDGEVTIFDASLIQRYLSGEEVVGMENRHYEIF